MAMSSQAAVELHLQSDKYQVFVNGQPASNNMKVGQNDQVRFVGPVYLPDGNVVIDTADQQLPIGQLSGQELSLIQGEQPGTWSWAYTAMIDTGFNQVLTITESANIGWDPRNTTLVSDEFKSGLSKTLYSGQGTIEMATYHPDKLVYKSSSSDTQLAVFSEVYFPEGWSATVDGNSTDILRVNYLLRAVEVPSGEHTIVLTYTNASFDKSTTYAHIGTVAIILLLLGGIFFETRREDNENQEVDEDGDDEDDNVVTENVEIADL